MGISENVGKIDSFSWILLFAIFGLLISFAWTTRDVPNTIYENVTMNVSVNASPDLIKGLVIVKTELSLDNQTILLTYTQSKLKYSAISLVPNDNVDNSMIFLTILLICVLVYRLIISSIPKGHLLSEEEVKAIVMANFTKKIKDRSSEFFDSVHGYAKDILPLGCILRRSRIGDTEKLPDMWIQDSEIMWEDGGKAYFRWEVHPYEGYIKSITEALEAMDRKDRCDKCGSSCDEKLTTPQEFGKMLRLIKKGSFDEGTQEEGWK